MGKLSVAVVGCGHNSDNHLRVYASSNEVKLVAVCDRNRGKAELKAHDYGAKQVSTDYESLLSLDLDLVDIVTPTPTHAALAVRALESGHNVLVEKPMALSSKECESMIAAEKRNGRSICVCHSKRFFSCIVHTETILNLEHLEASRVRCTHFFTVPYPRFGERWILKEESGGVLWDGLVHHVYLIEHFLGETQSVFAAANKVKLPIYDSIVLILNARGKTGVGEFEWNVKEPMQVFELLTAQGDRFSADVMHDLLLRRSRSYRGMRWTALRSLYDDIHDPAIKWAGHFQDTAVIRPFEKALPFERTFFTLILRYVSFLRGQMSAPPVRAEEGLQTIRVLEAAKKSIESGRAEVPT